MRKQTHVGGIWSVCQGTRCVFCLLVLLFFALDVGKYYSYTVTHVVFVVFFCWEDIKKDIFDFCAPICLTNILSNSTTVIQFQDAPMGQEYLPPISSCSCGHFSPFHVA